MTIPISEFVWLLILASVTAAVVRWIRVPYTVALVLVGLVVSAFGLLQEVRLTSDINPLVFLPPLLFEAALKIDVRDDTRSLLGQPNSDRLSNSQSGARHTGNRASESSGPHGI